MPSHPPAMIRALVVDDEPLARKRLRRLLGSHPDVQVVGDANSGETAVVATLQLRPDVLFLDVHMPGMTGLDTLRKLQEQLPAATRPLAILTTAHEEHALEAFEFEVVDYLVKPVAEDTLLRAVRRVRERLWERGADPARETAQPPAPTRPTPLGADDFLTHLASHQGSKILNIPVGEVGCILVENSVAYAHTDVGGQRLTASLQELGERLPEPPFVQVSRSAIVNLDWIAHVEPGFSGTFIATLKPPMKLEIPVSRRRARRLRDLLGW